MIECLQLFGVGYCRNGMALFPIAKDLSVMGYSKRSIACCSYPSRVTGYLHYRLSRQDLFELFHQRPALLGTQAVEILLPPSHGRQIGGGTQADSRPIGLALFERH